MGKITAEDINIGDVYFIAPGRTAHGIDYRSSLSFYETDSSCREILNDYESDGYVEFGFRDNIPYGSRAMVLKNPGEGAALRPTCRPALARLDYFECLIVDAKTLKTFVGVLTLNHLQREDPREDPAYCGIGGGDV